VWSANELQICGQLWSKAAELCEGFKIVSLPAENNQINMHIIFLTA
jgi:hypothetical protein